MVVDLVCRTFSLVDGELPASLQAVTVSYTVTVKSSFGVDICLYLFKNFMDFENKLCFISTLSPLLISLAALTCLDDANIYVQF